MELKVLRNLNSHGIFARGPVLYSALIIAMKNIIIIMITFFTMT